MDTNKKIVKLLKGQGRPTSAPPLIDGEAVYFNDENLVQLGSNSLDPSNYGLLIARKLFSDEELAKGMVGKKRESKGKIDICYI